MVNLTIEENGAVRSVRCETGTLLSDALRLHQCALAMPCAGKGRCGKCRVLAQGSLSVPTEGEQEFLSDDERRTGVRLACLTRVEGDARVRLLSAQEGRVVSEGSRRSFAYSPTSKGWGAAMDIGTTTVAAYLFRMSDGARLAQASAANPQAPWGADVISRIERALAGEGAHLARAITGELDRLLMEMARQADVECRDIDEIVITANTAMLYLLTQTAPGELARAPFEAKRRFGEWVSAGELGLSCCPGARVYLPRCASAFVGADITTAILSSGMAGGQDASLLLDIGTNGEMALYAQGKLTCCSTAAGPALEGGNIRMGMPALPGAIDSVTRKEGELAYSTIGGQKAAGLCGSGLIDAVAALLEYGIIEETGAIALEGHPFKGCLCEVESLPAFRFPDSQVVLTQQDIRNVQLAKGAICAGLLTLLARSGLRPEELAALYLAGGFGSYINISSAVKIGLIPRILGGKTQVIGNAAGVGACMLLQNREFRKETTGMADEMETVELSQNPEFTQFYMDCMMLEPVE